MPVALLLGLPGLLGLPSAAHAAPVPVTIIFTVGKTATVACTAVTDVTGTALCKPSALDNTKILLAGYTARFPGTASLLPVDQHQGLLG